MKSVVGIAFCLLSAASVQAADVKSSAKQIVGAWQLAFTGPDEVYREPIVIVGRQGDELAAWYVESDGKPQEFKEVRLVDDSLRLVLVPKSHDGEITVTLTAKLAGDDQCEVDATYAARDGDRGQWNFTGRRLKFSEFDEVSQWNLAFTPPDQPPYKAIVTFLEKDGKTYGWYSSDEYELPAKTMSVDGDRVKMVMEAKLPSGSIVNVTFDGIVDGDHVKGDATYRLDGESGEFPFTADAVQPH